MEKEFEKRLIIIMVIFAMMLVVMFSMVIAEAKSADNNTYALTARVVEVNYDTDTVTAEDYNGHLLQWKGTEDWEIGDCASMIVYDNNTQNISDDQIVSVRYGAWKLEK